MFKTFKFSKKEESYIDDLIFLLKDCWRCNYSELKTFVLFKRELNKMKLDKSKHPFLFDFRDKFNTVEVDNYDSQYVRGLMGDLHKYRLDRIKLQK